MAKTKRKTKQATLSEQLRAFIEAGPMTRYAISKETGIDQGQLHRFVNGTGRLGQDTIDALGRVLRLRLVQDGE